MRYYVKVFFAYMKKHILIWKEYFWDFNFMSFASLIYIAVSVLSVNIIFNQVNDILGWTKYEVLWMLGYYHMVQVFFGTFFINTLDVEYWVHSGTLDLLKTKPLSVFFQLLFSERYNSEFPVDELIVGVFLLINSSIKLNINFDIKIMLSLIYFILISVIIYVCTVFIISSLSFWTIKSNYIVEFILELEQLNQYPLVVYGKVIQNIFTFIIPIGFVSFYPSQFFLKNIDYYSYYTYLMPIISLILVLLSILIWNKGIKNYQSPNS